MVTKKRTGEWLSLKSRGNPQRFMNHQNQIVRRGKWLNQQLKEEAPKRVRYNVNGRLRFETAFFVRILTLKKLCKSVFFCFSPSYEKGDRKKHELEISTLDKIFVGQK